MTGVFELRAEPLDPLEVMRAVEHPSAGASVLFLGMVRDHSDGRTVTRLDYQAYEPMARRQMALIGTRIQESSPGVRVAVIHRVGSLGVGELAVVCAASAPHRGEAFSASRRLIDEIKEHVPIWKREYGPDGPYWVGWQDARCRGHAHLHAPGHKQDHCAGSVTGGKADLVVRGGVP